MTDQGRKEIAQKLRDAREEKELSQEEVALKLGLPRPAISQIENGRRRVEVLELIQLAKLYERPLEFFANEQPVASNRFEMFRRAAAGLSDEDRDQVLRFAEFLRDKANRNRKSE